MKNCVIPLITWSLSIKNPAKSAASSRSSFTALVSIPDSSSISPSKLAQSYEVPQLTESEGPTAAAVGANEVNISRQMVVDSIRLLMYRAERELVSVFSKHSSERNVPVFLRRDPLSLGLEGA